jgi:hypothetical protein
LTLAASEVSERNKTPILTMSTPLDHFGATPTVTPGWADRIG